MADMSRIAGIVLAGGRSSRMGKNKALLEFHGRPLVGHMMHILHNTGLQHIYISGSYKGYPCIADKQSFAGPVHGIYNVIDQKPEYKGYLFVPVDMPFLTADLLRRLLVQEKGAYFSDWPLPLYLVPPVDRNDSVSVRELIEGQNIDALPLSQRDKKMMINVNTPVQWQEALAVL